MFLASRMFTVSPCYEMIQETFIVS
jgi:hypothetical protein